jgi:hypothetical protein
MKTPVNRIVDIEAEVDLKELGAIQKVVVAIRNEIRGSSFFQRKRDKILEQEYRKRTAREENLKFQLLSVIYSQLIKNKSLEEKGRTCVAVVAPVLRSYEKELAIIKSHKEFSAVDMRIMECDPDMLRSFPSIPIFVRISMRGDESSAI